MSSRKKVAIIGANEFQNALILKAKEKCLETHVFSWGREEVGQKNADYFYEYDVRDVLGILGKSREIGIDAICSVASDLTNQTVNRIAAELKLIGNSIQCIELTTDKYSMRKKLKDKGLPCPSFALLNSIKTPIPRNLKWPLIVKPTDRSGSRGVAKVNTNDDLSAAIQNAIDVSFDNKAIVEDFLDGREYSVESISQNGAHKVLQVTEKVTTGAPNFIEVAHIAPARISKDLYDRIEQLTVNALSALEISNGASHTEVKLNISDELYIIEVGSRMGGDFIGSYLVEKNTCFDYLNSVLEISLGCDISVKDICIKKDENRFSMINYFFDEESANKFLNRFGEYVAEFIPNRNFTGKIENSADRHSCVQLTVNKDKFDDICKHLRC